MSITGNYLLYIQYETIQVFKSTTVVVVFSWYGFSRTAYMHAGNAVLPIRLGIKIGKTAFPTYILRGYIRRAYLSKPLPFS
jgi:hypothetical protein